MIREEDQSASWHYSDTNNSATALSMSLTADHIGVPGTWLTREEKRKHRKKMKNERDKMLRVGWKEKVSYN